VKTRDVHPEEFGLPRASLDQLKGGDATTNARLLLSVLESERSPYRDVVLANAAAAFTLAGKAQNFADGVHRAAAGDRFGRGTRHAPRSRGLHPAVPRLSLLLTIATMGTLNSPRRGTRP